MATGKHCLAATLFALTACKTAGPAATAASSPTPASAATATPISAPPYARVLLHTPEVVVLGLDAPGFADLPREQRLFAYWLAQVGNAGDAIAWDQGYRHNLAIVRLLRGILKHPQAVQAATLRRVRQFARTLYLQRGLHDRESGRKAQPPFTPAELRVAALAAQAAGALFGLPAGTRLEAHLRALEGPLFDPRVDAIRTEKQPGTRDALLASAVNLYDGVSLRDLRGFRERYPLNSRLVKQDGRLVEQVYRMDGLYGGRLARAVAALEQAIPLAQGAQRTSLEELAAHLRTGDPERFRLSQRAWVSDAAAVDYLLGFVETSADPRGRKGIWEGFTGMRDGARSAVLERLAASAQGFEDAMPWPPELKRSRIGPAPAEALWLLAGSGENRPQAFTSVNLPDEQAERELHGSKSLLLPSVDEALGAVREVPLVRELSPPGLGEEQARCHGEQRFALMALHEIVGHPSGRAAPELAQRGADPAEILGQDYDLLEEARADLVAHWHALERRTQEAGLLPDARCRELYPQFATTGWLLALAGTPDGDRIEEDHLRAAQLQLWWFTAKGAVAERRAGGKRYLTVADGERWHAAAGELLALLQQIKSTGDAAKLKQLAGDHANRPDPAWRDELLARMRALGVPRRAYALPPVLQPVVADGKALDATLAAIDDLDAQILRDWADF